MQELTDQIFRILSDARFDDEVCGDTRSDAIWALVTSDVAWETVRDGMIAVLADDGAAKHWVTATVVLWFGVARPMPRARVIALLHHRLMAESPPRLALDENLVWSITSNLKGVGYLSDYEPLNDPEVQDELKRLRTRWP